MTEGASDGIYLVTSLYYFEQIIRAIQTSDEVLMDHLLVIYGSIVIVYLVIKIFIRHWGWGEIFASMSRFLVEKYLSRYIEAEPNTTEKIGTGRFVSIFQKGEHTWANTYHDFYSNSLPLLFASIYGIWRVSMIN